MKSIHALTVAEHRDFEGARLGMWLFLITELILFTGMFLPYAMYRLKYAAAFHKASLELDVVIGTMNTLVLLTSSLTVALSIEALKRNSRKLSLWLLGATIFLALVFLVNKYFEWGAKIHHGIYPGSQELMQRNLGEVIYFNLYYAMTGLHGLHVLVGMGVLTWIFVLIARKSRKKYVVHNPHVEQLVGSEIAIVKGDKEGWRVDKIDDNVEQVEITITYEPKSGEVDLPNIIKLENAVLYWHLADIIWIFLFPLFYLIS